MTERYRAVIVDDEQRALNILKHLLSDHEDIEIIGMAKKVDEAMPIIIEHGPDLVFLDIQMPGKSGFELIHELSQYQLSPTIIFTTAYSQYVIDAIRHEAFDYLVKPIDPMELKKALIRFRNNHHAPDARRIKDDTLEQDIPDKLRFNTRTGSVFLHSSEIIYIKADGNYSEIFSKGKRTVVTTNLSRIMEKLGTHSFFRASRSFIININCLSQVDRRKKTCILEHEDERIELTIPLDYIRELERRL